MPATPQEIAAAEAAAVAKLAAAREQIAQDAAEVLKNAGFEGAPSAAPSCWATSTASPAASTTATYAPVTPTTARSTIPSPWSVDHGDGVGIGPPDPCLLSAGGK